MSKEESSALEELKKDKEFDIRYLDENLILSINGLSYPY